MPIQTATTGNLEDAQNIIISECRYTAEYNAPCVNLIEHFRLGKGEKQITVPKVGQMTAQALTDGTDLVSSQAIGLTTTDLTPSEVGLKALLTDKLIRQFNEDVFKVIGRQMGDAMARKRDTDVIALFSALNGGTYYGGAARYLNLVNASACVANMMGKKAPLPIFVVHHPHAIGYLARQSAGVGTTYFHGVMQGWSEEKLRNFWKINIDGVNFFQDGNIAVASGSGGYGVIASKSAMAFVESLAPNTERERDASLRAWEVVLVSDYGCFELDDGYGVPMLYYVTALGTSTT